MLRYTSGAVLNGSNLREALEAASAILVAEGFPAIPIVSGDREYDEQVAIFLARYVPSNQVNGRRVYDFRWWEGRQWARISPAGTVAAPSRTAPHVAKIAADLGWPYNDRSTAAHRRLQQIAPGLGLDWTGRNFGEDWHWETTRGVGRIGAGQPASTDAQPKEWDEMATEAQIRSIVADEIRAEIRKTRTNEHFIVSYASETDRNGIVVAGFGYWHKLTKEEWDHFNWLQSNNGLTIFAGLHIFTPINDRSYDILRDVCLQDGVAQGEGGLTYQEVLTIMESAPPAKIKALALDGTKPTVGLVDAPA